MTHPGTRPAAVWFLYSEDDSPLGAGLSKPGRHHARHRLATRRWRSLEFCRGCVVRGIGDQLRNAQVSGRSTHPNVTRSRAVRPYVWHVTICPTLQGRAGFLRLRIARPIEQTGSDAREHAGWTVSLAFAYPEEFSSAGATGPACSGSTVLHRDLRGVLDFSLGPALHAERLPLGTSMGILRQL